MFKSSIRKAVESAIFARIQKAEQDFEEGVRKLEVELEVKREQLHTTLVTEILSKVI